MWELDYKESLAKKNWCFWTVVLEKTLGSPLDCKEIQPVYPKGNQSWIFIGRTDAEAEAPILWPPDSKSWLIWKDLDAGKDWGQEEKGTTEDEMVGWHHWLDGHEFEQAPGIGDGQGGLVCYSPWGCKESGTTKWLNWTEDEDEQQSNISRGCGQSKHVRSYSLNKDKWCCLSLRWDTVHQGENTLTRTRLGWVLLGKRKDEDGGFKLHFRGSQTLPN